MQVVSDPAFAHTSLTTQRVPLNRVVVASAVTASLGGLLFGFDTAVISGVTKALTSRFDLNAKTFAFTVAVALWGTRMLAGLFIASALGCALA